MFASCCVCLVDWWWFCWFNVILVGCLFICCCLWWLFELRYCLFLKVVIVCLCCVGWLVVCLFKCFGCLFNSCVDWLDDVCWLLVGRLLFVGLFG